MAIILKKMLKNFIYSIACLGGIITLSRYFNRNSITILMLHGVMEEQKDSQWLPLRPHISPVYLAKALTSLKLYYNFISLESAIEMLQGSIPIKPNSIVLTFDDGYRNSIKYALPILDNLQIPATIFLATGHIENRTPFWFDRLDYALQQLPHHKISTVTIAGKSFRIDPTHRDQLKVSYKQLRNFVKSKKMNDIEMLAEFEKLSERLEKKSGKKISDIFEYDDWSVILTWNDINAVNNPLITWGCHTVDHVRLNLVSENIAHDQLLKSKTAIKEKLKRECLHFCYPDGGYSPQIIEIACKCGYKSAVSVDEGLNKLDSNIMKLKRIPFPLTGNKYKLLSRIANVL